MTLAIVWTYVKKYWQIAVAIVLFVVGFFWFKSETTSLSDVLEKNRKRHQEELDEIKKAHEQELRDKEAALKRMQDTLAQIEKLYQEAQKELDAKKKKEIEKIIQETNDDPEELARRLHESTGFKIVVGE